MVQGACGGVHSSLRTGFLRERGVRRGEIGCTPSAVRARLATLLFGKPAHRVLVRLRFPATPGNSAGSLSRVGQAALRSTSGTGIFPT